MYNQLRLNMHKKPSANTDGFIFKCNAVHLPSTAAHKRYSCRQLGLGDPAAHERVHLMLLPSGPDMVHGFPLRRTQTSTLRARGRPYNTDSLEKGFSLARADCKLQGTATSPPSTAFLSILFFYTKINSKLFSFFILKLLTLCFKHGKLDFVVTEEYPSLAEGIGLENRQGC